ncbi:MAG: methionine--tRNA ligase, partial [Candidatus Liptonbacteria bacterium RIFOXYB1_FULL_36_10]
MERKTVFISTAIPYVNAKPHIGFALELVEADVFARFKRVNNNDVFLLTGTDENSLKNVQTAEELNIPTAEFVEKNAKFFQKLAVDLNISNDGFIRTSIEEKHKKGAEKLWSSCRPEDIYKKQYKGFYCVGCEEFKTAKDLENGKCPEHPNREVEIVEEENYFFKLSNYQNKLKEIIETGKMEIIPETRKNEMLSFINSGLEDFSISRSNERAKKWGIKVPQDEEQTIYVWFDALSNYITALDYTSAGEKFKKYWEEGSEIIHVIGKGINRFHTIYWPAMLLSAGVRIPTKIFIHGYITSAGQKMSKSLGNVVDPFELIEKYGADALR